MANDIEQIAPTPWAAQGCTVIDGHGKVVCTCTSFGTDDKEARLRDHIIRCVNACEKMNPEAVPELLAVCGEVDDYFGDTWADEEDWPKRALARRIRAALEKAKVPDAKPQPPADVGFAQVSALVKGLAQVSQLPGNERKPQ